jgi:small subunit ribosomal protein S5
MGLVEKRPAKDVFKPYTEEDKVVLKKWYTPAQLRAIEAGEAHITPEDLDRRGVIRTDYGALDYFDDFSQLRTIVDTKPANEMPNHPKARMATNAEFEMAFVKWLDKVKELEPAGLTRDDPDWAKKMRPNRADFLRFTNEVNATAGPNGLEDPYPISQFVPNPAPSEEEALELKKDETTYEKAEEENDERDPDGIYNLLRKQTGIELDEILDLKTKVLVMHRVVNQTRLGKIDSLYCLAIAGNGKGRLGIGQAKGQEPDNTQNLAKIAAIKNMRPIPRYEERTIFGEVKGKVSAATVTLMARPPGKILYINFRFDC